MQSNKLYVGNLNYEVADEELKELFSEYGEVKEVKIIGDKGFGFVEMSSQAEAEKAKNELDGHEFKGRNLRVNEARPQRDKGRKNFRRF